ncbi:MAG: hypothetical protein Q8P26_03860 [Candidatus Levybacteria bacterium]|nr:hypothetical protein [Candidatus Levybacteria bacterium]
MDNNDTNKIFEEVVEEKYPPIDTSKFLPLTTQDIIGTLGLTIKKDETNKLITFLSQLSAYTESSQINISFNAPSSSGKSFIPLEISQLFPPEDVLKLGGCSPTAFFHDQGVYDKETNTIRVDLSRKIIIFLDQPNSQLLEKLRSLLSHDEKEIHLKITDKNQRGGNRTKNVILIGFPVVIFCTAGLRLDEQEATRFLLLSPEINKEKIREAIDEKIKKDSDSVTYKRVLEANPDRQLLKERILAIRQENIKGIKIKTPELIEQRFFEKVKSLKPRHQRDIGRIISIIKVSALLNLWHREREGLTLIANQEDIEQAFVMWNLIWESQELNLPPYVYDMYKDVIVSAYSNKNSGSGGGVGLGLTRQEILQKHFDIYGRFLPDWQLRQHIIPMLETSGLITQEADQNDKRKILIYPTASPAIPNEANNSELDSGVEMQGVVGEAVST